MKKIDLHELYFFIVNFKKDYGVIPGTAILVNKFKVHPQTIRENLKKLNKLEMIKFKEGNAYNVNYKIL